MKRVLLVLLALAVPAMGGTAAPTQAAPTADHVQLARAGGGSAGFRARPSFRGTRRGRPGFGGGFFFLGAPGGALTLILLLLVLFWLARRSRRY